GGGDDHVTVVQARLVQRRYLARVGEQPLRPRHAVDLDGLRVAVDEQHLVAVLQELGGDGAADRPRSGDGDPHQSSSSGTAASTLLIRSMSRSAAIMWTMSPSCTTVVPVITTASPIRLMNAARARTRSSRSTTRVPIHAGLTVTSASTTVPVGSRQSGSVPSGSRRRRIWSAVQRTVATVGMPSRW